MKCTLNPDLKDKSITEFTEPMLVTNGISIYFLYDKGRLPKTAHAVMWYIKPRTGASNILNTGAYSILSMSLDNESLLPYTGSITLEND